MNSLGINKPKKETKVVVAMSGGVDSSVVAALMKQEGFDVTGITLKLYDDSKQSKRSRPILLVSQVWNGYLSVNIGGQQATWKE